MAEWTYTIADTTIVQTEFADWLLRHAGQTYISLRPQPLLNKALTEGWWTLEQIQEVKRNLGL